MAAVSVAAEWQLLFNRYYRKFEVYQMQWKHVDLTRNKVACAPFGGPIAVIRDDGKIVQLYAESALRKLRIFNSAGVQIAETVWKNPGGRLIGMAWSEDLTLHCITQDGTIYCYSVHAELLKTLTIGEDRLKYSIAECVFWGNGVVCMNEAFQLFCISDFRNPEPVKLADTGLEDPPRCMAVIEPQYTMSGNVEVLLAVEDYVMVVEEDGTQQIGAEFGPYQKIVVSGNGKYVACFTVDGTLLVLPSDFSDIAFQYQCESVLPPDQLAWCGMDSVLLYWDDMLLMVGPSDGDLDPVRYFYDDPILIIPECDGVRVLSNHGMEFLQRVPDSTVSIFQIGSTMPAALLFDALDHFDRRSAKADENLRLIRSSLPEAVEACIDAASHEFNVSLQRTLLRAASYGQAFCSQFQRNYIRDTSRMLRVLNAVRNIDVGMPLSIQQYKLLTPSVLIGRLINAHLHLQALEISRYLEMNQEVVIMNWACAKISVSTSIPDPDLLEILLDKLRLCKGISYAAVASHADNSGRRKLAAMLVEHEPRSSKQVPLLLSIGEEVTALTKATESGDTDLVYLVLFHVRQKGPAMEFHRTIQARSLARDLFVSYARVYKRDFLKNFLASTGDVQDVAFLFLKESWEMAKNPVASRGSPINGPRIKLIENAHKLFSETKEHVFESKEAEEHAKLLRIQQELEITTKQPIFVDSSVIDTIRTCIVLGNHRAALKVKTEFKVSDKQWYWLKAFALATIRDWDALEKFSKEKRPPSYRPFVEACIEADEKVEAAKYIPKLSDPEDRAKAYVRIGMTKEADDVALQSKDNELLGRLKSTFSQNAGASSIFDTFRLSFQGIS